MRNKCLLFTGLLLCILSSCAPKQEEEAGEKNEEMTPEKTMVGQSTADASLTETYWKLLVLDGDSVPPPSDNANEVHLILHREGHTVNGFAGCNGISGTYEHKVEALRLKFSKMTSTLMSCDRINLEQKFTSVLEMVDNYAIRADTLSLHKAKMAPLARFVAVYH